MERLVETSQHRSVGRFLFWCNDRNVSPWYSLCCLVSKRINASGLGNCCLCCQRSHPKAWELWLVSWSLFRVLDSLFNSNQQCGPGRASVHGYAMVRIPEDQGLGKEGYQEDLLFLADCVCHLGCSL